eukprot:CAMPEP_0173443756 /NCGR_PEP_ID=MMETSP1357-20121228/30659_1 /TAXON_ID=77926 /ORGANISM="Hemiselmis rufescens, Strain PCC563" /LENGTH=316 /DNA_ID=CAMNT_0014409709 /DNA_START=214 /DNA_END=1163 /DNA_ORIENTATION=+
MILATFRPTPLPAPAATPPLHQATAPAASTSRRRRAAPCARAAPRHRRFLASPNFALVSPTLSPAPPLLPVRPAAAPRRRALRRALVARRVGPRRQVGVSRCCFRHLFALLRTLVWHIGEGGRGGRSAGARTSPSLHRLLRATCRAAAADEASISMPSRGAGRRGGMVTKVCLVCVLEMITTAPKTYQDSSPRAESLSKPRDSTSSKAQETQVAVRFDVSVARAVASRGLRCRVSVALVRYGVSVVGAVVVAVVSVVRSAVCWCLWGVGTVVVGRELWCRWVVSRGEGASEVRWFGARCLGGGGGGEAGEFGGRAT